MARHGLLSNLVHVSVHLGSYQWAYCISNRYDYLHALSVLLLWLWVYHFYHVGIQGHTPWVRTYLVEYG